MKKADKYRCSAAVIFLSLILISSSFITGNAAYSKVTGNTATWTPDDSSVTRELTAYLYYQVTETATTYKIDVYTYAKYTKKNVHSKLESTTSLTNATSSTASKSFSYSSGGSNTTWTGKMGSTVSHTWTKTKASQSATAKSKIILYNGHGTKKGTSTASKTFTIPALNKFTINYYANGAETDNGSALTGQLLATSTYYYNQADFETDGLPDYNGGTWDLAKSGYMATGSWIVGSGTGTRKISQSAAYATTQELYEAISGISWAGTADGGTIDLYAEWASAVNVGFNANGGSLADAHGSGISLLADGSICENNEVISLALPAVFPSPSDSTGINLVRTGYHLRDMPWNSQTDGKGNSYDAAAAYNNYTENKCWDSLLYANWEADSYTIRYMPNGAGSGSMPDQDAVYGEKVKTQPNGYIRSGFRLAGWDRDPDADPEGTLDIAGNGGTIPNLILADHCDGDIIELYAIWREMSPSDGVIFIGKVKNTAGGGDELADEAFFLIEAVEGMSSDNESSLESGRSISAENMPMPDGTAEGSTSLSVTMDGLAGSGGRLCIADTGEIHFEAPGWYMYRVTETVEGVTAEDGEGEETCLVEYDKDSYYVVFYVRYLEETGGSMQVYAATAWHNQSGRPEKMPNLEDISSLPDVSKDDNRDGDYSEPELSYYSLQSNNEGVYGKTYLDVQTAVVKFWNTEYTEGFPEDTDNCNVNLLIVKNVKGNLGDRTKKFEYTAGLSGLSENTTYAVEKEGAELDTGFAGSSFTTDENGEAELGFRLRDDDSIFIADLPANAVANVTESGSDHVPGYEVKTGDDEMVKAGNALFGDSVSTGNISMPNDGNDIGFTYIFRFDNYRELAVNTGVLSDIAPFAALAALMIAALAVLLVRA